MKIRTWVGTLGVITAVGTKYVLVQLNDDRDERPLAPSNFEPIPMFPELWINVYPNGIGQETRTREVADRNARQAAPAAKRIGVIHLAADGTLTMEQP